MPRSKSWASPGGIAPIGLSFNLETDRFYSNEVKAGEGVQERDGQLDQQEGEKDQHHHHLGEDRDAQRQQPEVGEPGDRQHHHREEQEPHHQQHHHQEGGGDQSCNYSSTSGLICYKSCS